MFWAVGLNTYCVGGKEIYLWQELLAFAGLNNNVHKVQRLIIENGGLLRLDKKILSFDRCFEADIIAIW